MVGEFQDEGKRHHYQANKVARTNCCAGIYLATETAWNTLNVNNVIVRNNLLMDNSGWTKHGAIMIFADRGSVRDIRLEHNVVVNSRHAAVSMWGAVADVAIVANHFVDPADGSITGAGTNVYCAENTLDDTRILVAKNCNTSVSPIVRGLVDNVRALSVRPETSRVP